MTKNGPKVLEYNARFGDPETQTMMMLMAPECDLAAVLLARSTGRLDTVSIPVLPGYACNVVIAADGYPLSYSEGDVITLTKPPEGLLSLSPFSPFLSATVAVSLKRPGDAFSLLLPMARPFRMPYLQHTEEWRAFDLKACSIERISLHGKRVLAGTSPLVTVGRSKQVIANYKVIRALSA